MGALRALKGCEPAKHHRPVWLAAVPQRARSRSGKKLSLGRTDVDELPRDKPQGAEIACAVPARRRCGVGETLGLACGPGQPSEVSYGERVGSGV
jgi:hypothetical protein